MKTITLTLLMVMLSSVVKAQNPDPSKWMCRNLADSGGFTYQGESIFGTQACRLIAQTAPAAAPSSAVATVETPKQDSSTVTPAPAAVPSSLDPPPDVEVVPPAQAQQVLRALIPSDKKLVTINAYVAGTSVKDVNLGVYCSSSSSANTSGTVDDDGNIKARTNSDGSTNCRERHVYYHRMSLGLPDGTDGNAAYLVTVECTVRRVWDHCQMPPEGSTYPIVLEAGKHGTFQIYAATTEKLGAKAKVAKFPVLDIEHVKMNTATTSAN